MTAERRTSDSGVELYPRLPIPKRESVPQVPRPPRPAWPGRRRLAVGVGIVAAILGISAGFLIRPIVSPDARVATLEKRAAGAEAAAASLQRRLDDTATQIAAKQAKLDELTKQLADAAQAQDVLAGEAAQAKAAAASAQAAQAKLAASVDKASGTVSQEGEEIHLQIVDKVLFKVGDDQLTDKGKQVLDKVAAALKEIPDKQIWVQGHTDDSPIVPLPPKKGAKPPPAPPKPITNWELSAARALTVVHYLQDVQHLDPSRLAALAFGQYRPISKTNKALDRRIEIVLVPHVPNP